MNEPARGTLEIANFSNELNTKTKVFNLSQNDQIEFTLYCLPKFTQFNNNIIYSQHMAIYLGLSKCALPQVRVQHEISILNANGDKCEQQDRIEVYTKSTYGGLYLIKHDHLTKSENGLLVNGKLSIHCEIKQINSTEEFFSIRNEPCPKLPDSPILEDYKSLLESGKFSDASLIIKIGEKRLNVHKNILSARSKVFAAMFENDCVEKRQNRVEIIDISAEVCEQMLIYIYTGQTPDMSKYAADLFVAADKYQLDHLKSVCEQVLSTKIDVESAANTLLVADMHHATVLKTKAIDFIVVNASKVMATEGWKTLASRADLVVDLFQKMTIKAKF